MLQRVSTIRWLASFWLLIGWQITTSFYRSLSGSRAWQSHYSTSGLDLPAQHKAIQDSNWQKVDTLGDAAPTYSDIRSIVIMCEALRINKLIFETKRHNNMIEQTHRGSPFFKRWKFAGICEMDEIKMKGPWPIQNVQLYIRRGFT